MAYQVTTASNDRLVTSDDLFNLSKEDRKQMELRKESDNELQKSQKEFLLAEQVKSYFEVNNSFRKQCILT
jgi:ATP-dependent Lon protease